MGIMSNSLSTEQIKLSLEDMNPLEVLEILDLDRIDPLIEALEEFINENYSSIEANLRLYGVI